MSSSFLSKLDLAVRYQESIGEAHMAQYLRNQFDVLRNIMEYKKAYVAATYYVPGELLELLDVEAVYMERFAGLAAAWRLIDQPVSRAISKGFPACSCSYQALFDLLIEEELLPKPAGFAALRYACNDAWTYCKTAAEKYNVPFYYIDVPKLPGADQQQSFTKQLENLYHELKISFPSKTDIADVIAASNEAQDIKYEIDALRQTIPGNILDFFKLFPIYNDLGKKSTVEILKLFKNKLKRAASDDKQNLQPKILWLGIVPLYRNSIISDIEKKLNCKVVCEEMFDFGGVKIGYGTFFEDLAQRIMCSRFFSPVSRIGAILKNIGDFGITGIIHFSQRNCRFLPPMVSSIRIKADEKNIPFLEIQGDVVDPDYFDEAEAWNQLEYFRELIHGRA